MLNPGADMIVFRRKKDLRLVLQPAKGIGVDNRRGVPEKDTPLIFLPRPFPSLKQVRTDRIYEVHCLSVAHHRYFGNASGRPDARGPDARGIKKRKENDLIFLSKTPKMDY